LTKIRGLGAAALCAATFCFSASESQAAAQVVTVAGPPELTGALMPATLEAFAAKRGYMLNREFSSPEDVGFLLARPESAEAEVLLKVQTTTSAGARAAMAEGQAQLALVRGPITDGPGEVLAEDAMIPVVSRANPVTSITPARLAAVLRGEITSWADLGGEDAPIHLYLPEPDTDQARLLDYYFLHGQPAALSSDIQLSAVALTNAVEADPLGMGVIGYSAAANTRALALAGDCPIEVAAGPLSIRNEDYPLSFAISLVVAPGEVPPMVAEYLDFLRSDEAQAAVRQAGFVGRDTRAEPLTSQGRRLVNALKLSGSGAPADDLRRLAETLDGQARLTVTFRFEPGSSNLDAGSEERAERLATALRSGVYDGRALTFVGFSDGVGAPDQNLKIGQARAEAVEAAIRAAAGSLEGQGVAIGSESFGEALPIACDDSDWGRTLNRRVEVWVK